MTITPAVAHTFEDYLALDCEQRTEWVDGALIEMNPPTLEHFLIAKWLEQCFDAEIKRLQQPWLCFREAGVHTSLRRSRLTDICVVTLEQAKALKGTSTVFQTPPLLAVEVVSADSSNRDYRHKRSEYAAMGIPEYWIVNPLTRAVALLVLNEGLYDETVLTGEQRLSSVLFPSLSLRVEDIFAAGDV